MNKKYKKSYKKTLSKKIKNILYLKYDILKNDPKNMQKPKIETIQKVI